MSRNASGVYTLPAGNPVVSGTVISSTVRNTTMNDLADALTDSLSRTGKGGMTAPLLLPDGGASLPALSFSADPNMGVYRAGANILAMSIAGVQRLRATSAGVVVTGTGEITGNATVGGTLGVTGAVTLASVGVTGNATVGGTLGVTGVTTLSGNATVGGTLGVTGASTLASLGVTGNATVGGTLGVTGVTTLSGNATVGGTLGVTGVTTLNARTNIVTNSSGATPSTAADELVVESSGTGGISILTSSTAAGQIAFGDPGSNVVGQIQYNHTDDSLRFRVNDAERARITSGGNFGIGVAEPDYPLDVQTGSTAIIKGRHSDGTSVFQIESFGTTGTDAGVLLRLYNQTGATSIQLDARSGSIRSTYFNSNYVGIGNSAPARRLHVSQDISSSIAALFQSANAEGGITLMGSGTISDAQVRVMAAGNELSLYAGGNARVRVDSSGNVGIGTTSPGAKLQVDGTFRAQGSVFSDNSTYTVTSSGQVSLRKADDNPFISFHGNTGARNGFINMVGNTDFRFLSGGYLSFWPSNTEDMRLTSGGDLLVDGNVVAYSTTISDLRHKEDLRTISAPESKLGFLSGYHFRWKESGQWDVGLIAQEVEAVLPHAVQEVETLGKGKSKVLNPYGVTGLLVEVGKAHTQRLNDIERRLAAAGF